MTRNAFWGLCIGLCLTGTQAIAQKMESKSIKTTDKTDSISFHIDGITEGETLFTVIGGPEAPVINAGMPGTEGIQGGFEVSIRPRACFFPLFSFLPLWLHYNLNPLCVQY